MIGLRLDDAQRFTCSQCGRCCRRPWEIVVTPAEVEAYRKAKLARLYREREDAPEGTDQDPFERIHASLGFHRIRKRADGACGFLSPQNRCRIHEELGGARKPLTCRMFPYRFHPTQQGVLVSTSFCCPTTVANSGEPIAAQRREIQALRAEWFAVYPEKPGPLLFVKGRSLAPETLEALRASLQQVLDRPAAYGRPDLRANALRMAHWLEDLSRWRVLRLQDEAFLEYLTLTGRHAASADKLVAARAPSAVGRLLARGFLFVVAATRLTVENKSPAPLRLRLRLKLLRLLAHFHGLAPGVSGIELGATRRAGVSLGDPALGAIAYHYLRASLETLGSGRRPVLEELALAFSYLNAACALAAMKAAATGGSVDAAIFSEALMEAVDLTHADDRGALGRILGTLAGGIEALYLFAGAGR